MRLLRPVGGVAFLFLAAGASGSCGTALEDVLDNLVINQNTTPIPLPDNAQPPAEYPSTIAIAAPPGNIVAISLLVRLTHGRARDVDMLLVGPTGAASLVMADCLGDSALSDDLFTFNATSMTNVPAVTTPPPIPGGPFHATNVADAPEPDDDTFYPEASLPLGPYVADLGVFVGTNPTGTWRLYVKDDLAGGGGAGSVNAWQLWITVQ